MILQALVEYYQRRAVDPDADIAPFGFSLEKIGFVLVVDEHGALVQVEDIRDSKGSKKIPVQRLLPQAVKRSSGIAANLLWDNAEYVLGSTQKAKQSGPQSSTRPLSHVLLTNCCRSVTMSAYKPSPCGLLNRARYCLIRLRTTSIYRN